jgi:phosphopantothenoylcysteine decarboxylase/phosphopantothenate--cysteine ligase
MKILITSGGTKIPIDRVRSITNMSKGTFGSRIADAFYTKLFNDQVMSRDFSHKITFFMAKGSKRPMRQNIDNEYFDSGVDIMKYVEYSTFDEYKTGIEKLLSEEKFDIIVVAAAVSDYGIANYYDGKYRSREDDMCIKLVKLPKILPIMRKLAPNSIICGFKLLVDSTEDELVEAMRKQIAESDVDLVIGNDLRDIKADNHSLMVISKYNPIVRTYVQPPKDERKRCSVYPLAQNVVNECVEALILKCIDENLK